MKNATKQGYLIANIGDGIDISTRMETHRGTVQIGEGKNISTENNISPTLTTRCDCLGVVVNEK